jgi:hypothetical protein
MMVAVAGNARLSATLALHADRSAITDLAVTGELAGVPTGEVRYVRWADLRALPTERLRLEAEFSPGEQEVTAVPLEVVWRELNPTALADVVLATCGDGYASVYRRDFVATYRPFLVLEINGLGPDRWPPPGLKFNPQPYVISVSSRVASAVGSLLDAGHKKPWGVTTLEFASFAARFHGAFSGRRAVLSPRADVGREIWINSCTSCHVGPGDSFGGTKSGQPFAVLEAIAAYSPTLFRGYVHDPKSVNPSAKMEPHPHYTTDQLDALIAFVTAESAK